MSYPHGMSFWTKDEWKVLKNKRTDHYAKIRTQTMGQMLTQVGYPIISSNLVIYKRDNGRL